MNVGFQLLSDLNVDLADGLMAATRSFRGCLRKAFSNLFFLVCWHIRKERNAMYSSRQAVRLCSSLVTSKKN